MKNMAQGETVNLIEDVDKACLGYSEAIKQPLFNNNGSINKDCLDSFNNALLSLVETCNIEAQSRNISCEEELAWVDSARKGFRRVAKHKLAIGGIEKMRLFSKQSEDMQRKIYFEMIDCRKEV